MNNQRYLFFAGVSALLIASACGATDRSVDVGDNEGGANSGGNDGGRSPTAGKGPRGGEAGEPPGDAGGPNPPGSGGSAGDTSDNGCEEGAARCSGDTPEHCEEGVWVPQPMCAGTSPVCSNGICASMKISGSITTVAEATLGESIRLVDHGFELMPTLCGEVRGSTLCLTGGFRP